jgi:catechol 2,3-dioxygenase-like lactoylglutathione lyase family enzyme
MRAGSADPEAKEEMMELAMNTIDLIVSDMEAAITFYGRLGLDFKVDAAYPGHAGCDLPNALHLMLDTEKMQGESKPSWTRPTGDPRTYLAFQAPSPADVDIKYAELTGAGYKGVQEPWDAYWGMRFCIVHDPDGNGVYLFAPLPAAGG